MSLPRHIIAVSVLIATGTACVFAGGLGEHDEDDAALRYYGFVKDQSGRPVPAAQVTAALKGSVTFSVSTDATGAYRIPVPRLLPGVAPENITISCARAGYKQLRTLVRSNLNQKPLVAVEIECILQGPATK